MLPRNTSADLEREVCLFVRWSPNAVCFDGQLRPSILCIRIDIKCSERDVGEEMENGKRKKMYLNHVVGESLDQSRHLMVLRQQLHPVVPEAQQHPVSRKRNQIL